MMNDEVRGGKASVYLGLLLISIATLTSEILFMRIVSLVFFVVVVYAVIGIAMLGFSAAGTLLSVFPGLLKRLEEKLPALALTFAVLTPVTYYLATIPAPLAVGKAKFLLYLLSMSLLMTTHYFLAGLMISFLFTQRVGEINRLYFINLVGSGIGCFVVMTCISDLGAEGLILLVALLGGLGAVSFAIGGARKKTAGVAVVFCVAILFLFPRAAGLFRIEPTLYTKHLAYFFDLHPTAELEYQAWDPVARVDVASAEGSYIYMPEKVPYMFATNDASAGTLLLGMDKHWRDVNFTDYGTLGLPYWLKKNPEVLVIGLGGGTDIATALHYDAKKIYGVEISERMIEVVRDEFSSFLNFPYQQPNVEIFHDEGRSHVRRMKQKVDLIQMTGVDTMTARFGGSFVMAENFIYTVQSFKEMFQHLRDDGIFCVTRSSMHPVYPDKAMRTAAMGVEALRQLGEERPERHFIIVSQGIVLSTLMKRTPFTAAEIETFMDNLETFKVDPWNPFPFLEGVMDTRYEEGRRLLYRPGEFKDNQFGQYFKSVAEGTEAEFIDIYPWDMKPCTDDNPFYFVAERWDSLFRDLPVEIKDRPVGLIYQILQLLWFAFLALVLVLVPLFVFHRKGLKTTGTKASILYFSSLGIGFMLIEIGFMQKFTLFLGHPMYSVSVILFSLLVFSGFGSFASGLLRDVGLKRVMLGSILSLTAIASLYTFILDPIFHHFLTWPLQARIALSVALVAPLAFFMGMPFPTGLRMVERQAVSFVPWAWGINGSTSVVATLLAGLIAVFAGFSTVVVCAILVYLAGMLAMAASKMEG
jgi:SAM-dependent methyltransferase